jgi:hypothetical protein
MIALLGIPFFYTIIFELQGENPLSKDHLAKDVQLQHPPLGGPVCQVVAF